MKKVSYRNSLPKRREPIAPCDLPTPGPGEEGLSSSSELGGGRGYSMPGEPVTPAMYSELEEEPILPLRKKRKRSRPLDYEDLTDILVNLADEMDNEERYSLANVADFLLKKVAYQKSLNYGALFSDLLIKIADSDILNKNEVFIEITKEYNKVLRESIVLGKTLEAASMGAYQSSMAKAKNYVK